MWPKGVINRPLKAPGKKGPAQEARTRYRLLSSTGDHSYIKVQPDTGRTHQVRRHLAGVSHPILGDIRHGFAPAARQFLSKFKVDRIMLHARQLSLPHPITGERVHIVATPDSGWFDILEALGLSNPAGKPPGKGGRSRERIPLPEGADDGDEVMRQTQAMMQAMRRTSTPTTSRKTTPTSGALTSSPKQRTEEAQPIFPPHAAGQKPFPIALRARDGLLLVCPGLWGRLCRATREAALC